MVKISIYDYLFCIKDFMFYHQEYKSTGGCCHNFIREVLNLNFWECNCVETIGWESFVAYCGVYRLEFKLINVRILFEHQMVQTKFFFMFWDEFMFSILGSEVYEVKHAALLLCRLCAQFMKNLYLIVSLMILFDDLLLRFWWKI